MSSIHPGIRRLLREDGTTTDPVTAVRRRARAVVAHARGVGWEGPPFDMEVLASLNGIQLNEVDSLGQGREASHTPGVIIVSRRWPRRRRRYTIAHEIVHEFLPDEDDIRVEDLRPEERGGARGHVEFLCQVGAAELLMPEDAFCHALGADPLTFAHLTGLVHLFDVSIEAAARRAVDYAGQPLAVLFARPSGDQSPSDYVTKRDEATRVQAREDDLIVRAWVAKPHFAKSRVVIGEPIPRKSHIRRAWGWACYKPQDRRIYCKVESWPAYPELGSFRVEAIPLPLGKRPIEVLTLLARDARETPP